MITWLYAFAITAGSLCPATSSPDQQTSGTKTSGRMLTRWAARVSPDLPWPEYPRPLLVRNRWLNLNGSWEYAVTPGTGEPPAAWQGRILVPYPIESSLSGVGRGLTPIERLWYRRTFTVPPEWQVSPQAASGADAKSSPRGRPRVLLHFGAVDWEATVLVNGRLIGQHRGGYDPFHFDITDALTATGENTLTVQVYDPTDHGGQPRGKQVQKPGGIFYTPSTGIWQTVWLEPVPPGGFQAIRSEAEAKTGRVTFRAERLGGRSSEGAHWEVEVLAEGRTVTRRSARAGEPIAINIDKPRLWSPDAPFLCDVRARLVDGGAGDDIVSYFAFREVRVGPDEHGVNRMSLNGEPLFQFGPLDQGFWPDGLYAPPTDEAMKFDIEAVKKMGGNMLRKHVKVEPQRFYHWCDKLGVMVWQDMPSPFFRGKADTSGAPELTDEWKLNYEVELREMVNDFGQHPSIVMWVPFNEGWGQNDLAWARQMALKVKEWDPTRLVNNASGWTDTGVGDVLDIHAYPGPDAPRATPPRAGVLGEFGGLGLPLPGHTWVDKDNWGYVSYKNQQQLTDAYVALIERLPALIAQGLCAAVYTQTTDVEIEVNGWLTYDRDVWKIDPIRAAIAARRLFEPPPRIHPLAGTAAQDRQVWRFTTDRPPDGWHEERFDDSGWSPGTGGFGTAGTPGAIVGTQWTSDNIWIRRTFELSSTDLADPHWSIHHDEDAVIFINGVRAAAFSGYTTSYRLEPLSEAARKALRKGRNTLAIHCRQTTGGQFIDAGLFDVVYPERQSRRAK